MAENENTFVPTSGAPVQFIPDQDDIETVNIPKQKTTIIVEPKATEQAPPQNPTPAPTTPPPIQNESVATEQDWRSKIEQARREEQAAREAQASSTVSDASSSENISVTPKSVAAQLEATIAQTEPDSEAMISEEPKSEASEKSDDDIIYPKDDSEEAIFDIPIGNIQEDLTRLGMLFNPTGDPNIIRKRIAKDPNDFFTRIINVFAMVGTSVELMRTYLENDGKTPKHLTKATGNLEDIVERFVSAKQGEVQELTGKEAKLAVLARSKGLPRVHLFNSGFWIKLRPPRIAELSQWYNEVSIETKDFGRLIGGHVFLFSDVLLKKKFMEILPSLVVDSNLEGWRVPNRLAKFISFHDFDTIVWAVCTLIYKEAITINLHCTNEKCKYIAQNYKVDLSKLRLNNFDIIPPEALSYISKQLMSSDKVTAEQIKQYHKLLKFSDEITLNGVVYKRHVPSIYKFIELGSEFCQMILESIKGYTNEFAIDIDREVRINVAKSYLPWVYRVSTEQYSSADPEAIATQLELEAQTSGQLAESMLKYQFDTKISYFCYTMLECPKCHKTPSNVLTDYYPLDPTYLFFFQLSRQFNRMSL